MLGIVNWLYDILEKNFDGAEKWYKHYHITKSPYHGNKFEGNGCHRLLQQDSLDNLLERLRKSKCVANSLPFRAHNAMVTFRALRHSCFSTELHSDYESCIQQFKDSISQLGRPKITPKVSFATVFASFACVKCLARSRLLKSAPTMHCKLFCVLSSSDSLYHRSFGSLVGIC